MPLTITNSEYDTLLEKIGSLDAKLQRIKLDKRDFGRDAKERAAELTLNKALKLEIASCIEKSCNKIENTLDKNSWSKDAARSTATGVKKLVKRLEEDDVLFEGKTSSILGIVEMIEDIQAKKDVVVKTSRSTATSVKTLVKRLGKDDGKTVELLEDIQANLLGISKQMRVTENKDIKRWDEIMAHIYRDRWWQVWRWPVWNFRVSFSRKED